MNGTGKDVADDAIEALIQCAAICQTASRLIKNPNGFSDAIRITCIANCERCVTQLSPYSDMRACLEAASKCANYCKQLS